MLLLVVVKKNAVARVFYCGKANIMRERKCSLKKSFFYIVTYFFVEIKCIWQRAPAYAFSGSGPGLIELLDAYEKLHMGVWDGNSAAYVRVLAVDRIWDYVNRNWSCFPQNKKSKVISLAKIRPARSVCGAPNNTCYLIDKKKSTLSSAFHSECITLQERNKTSFCLLP